MPVVRIELFPSRSTAVKHRIARGITRVLQDEAAISPEATTVIFTEVQPSDWLVAGKPLGAAAGDDPAD